MKSMPIVGIVVGLAAIGLGIAALVSSGNSAASLRAKTGAIEMQLTDVSTRLAAIETAQKKPGGEKPLDELSVRVMALKSEQSKTKDTLEELTTKVQELSEQIKKMEGQPVATATGQTTVAAVDDEKIRGIVRQEIQAQMARGFGRQREDARTALKTRVGLDDAKTEQVAQIVDKLSGDIRDVWQNNRGGDRDQNIAQMQELQKAADEQVAGILTPDEMEKYNQWQVEQRNRGGRSRRGDNTNQNTPAETPAPGQQF